MNEPQHMLSMKCLPIRHEVLIVISSVTVKSLFAYISWITGQIHMIKLALESAYQYISKDI